MEVYFDESGNTGCIMSKNGLLNFSSQPVFVLGSVITSGEEDKKELMDKYQRFKTEFNIDGEIKGSELMTRRRNKELEYLLDNVFDNTHFYVNIYNKRFYICTLLLLSLIGQEFRDTMPVCFYQQASMLAFQDDKFFVEYFNYISNPTEERFHNYLSFLNCFSYLGTVNK